MRHTQGGLQITNIQWILGHRHLSTTQVYLNPLPEDVIAAAVAYFQRRGQPAAPGTEPGTAPVYDPASLSILFGTDGS